ncbi:NADPH2:quinone reductase [Nocardia transvalensis]|uniref:NADPH2:quinone reductase n=1 Tax=Nocardia transvalensis TaxID=37333 RepID=A0A7W9UMF4_9NOCA|nr:zinc-binding dehydrogenase [Nocardia transvalensis]MBB5918559.1 NADPH2:quinone reductase [Nocardia transvalensis]
MRAIRVSRFGGPDVLELVEDLPSPAPGTGEVLVDVAVVGVGWLDTRIRAGEGPPVFEVDLPFVPGSAVAGRVSAVGPGVDRTWLNTVVVTHAAGGYGGGYADTVRASVDATFPLPEGLDARTAVAVLDDGSTALALLENTPVAPGDLVLVQPGLGGLGSLLVQLATTAGARVIAAVRGPEKVARARRLGVAAVDYSDPDVTAQLSVITGGRKLDVVFDGIGGSLGAASSALLDDGGRFSGYGMTSGAETLVDVAARRRLTVTDMSQLPTFWPDAPRRVRQVLAEAAADRLVPIVGQTYALEDAVTAHADIEARSVVGKSLLLV